MMDDFCQAKTMRKVHVIISLSILVDDDSYRLWQATAEHHLGLQEVERRLFSDKNLCLSTTRDRTTTL